MQAGYTVLKEVCFSSLQHANLSLDEAIAVALLKMHYMSLVGPIEPEVRIRLQQDCFSGRDYGIMKYYVDPVQRELLAANNKMATRRFLSVLSCLYGLAIPTSLVCMDRVASAFYHYLLAEIFELEELSIDSAKIEPGNVTQYAKYWSQSSPEGELLLYFNIMYKFVWRAYTEVQSAGSLQYAAPEYLAYRMSSVIRHAAGELSQAAKVMLANDDYFIAMLRRIVTANSVLYSLPIPKDWVLLDDQTIALYLNLAGRQYEVMTKPKAQLTVVK